MQILGPRGQPLPLTNRQRLLLRLKNTWQNIPKGVKWFFGLAASVAVLLTCIVHTHTIWTWLHPQNRTETPSKTAGAPPDTKNALVSLPFSEDLSEIKVLIGGNYYVYTRGELENREILLETPMESPSPFTIGIDNGRLFVGAHFTDLQISKGRFTTLLPPKYDFNWNETAWEIVDQKLRPALQIYYKSATTVAITGFWRSVGSKTTIFLTETNILINPAKGSTIYIPQRIFKYPGWQHRGEFEPHTLN